MAQLESKIENDFVDKALKEYGCLAFKFKREAIKGGSDRLIFCPQGRTFFIEFKRSGGIISEHQKDFKSMMELMNKKVYFCYSLNQAIKVLEAELKLDK